MSDSSSPGFDLQRAVRSAVHYRAATGVNCFIIDPEGRALHETDLEDGPCAFCRAYHRITGEKEQCLQSHLYGSYQAERFGGRYIYFCPIGLVHWASPILARGMLRGAFLGGPVLLVEPGEFFDEDILKKHAFSVLDKTRLCELLPRIPFVEPERVTALSELLFTVSASLSFDETRDRGMEALEQQSEISAYIHHIKTMGGDQSAGDEYPVREERALLKLIASGDKDGARTLLNTILGHVFFSSGGKLDIVKARVLELVVLLSRAAMEGGADVEQIFGLNYKYLNEVQKFSSMEDLSYWLSRIMVRFTELVFDLRTVKHVDVMYKAIDFIKRHYMNKLSLRDVAAHVRLSPSYFSKLFKQELGRNFSHFLNEIRIERCKAALLDDSVPLVDIAFLTGFEDQSYFTKVFKRLVGVSPGRFRETRGRSIQEV